MSVPTTPHRRRHYGGTAVFPLLLLVSVLCLRAQTPEPRLLFTGHLNNDCYEDRVYGRVMGAAQTWLPEIILWGRPDSLASGCPDSSLAPAITATQFVYPAWHHFAGTVSFTQVNHNDTRTDMLLFLWGSTDSAATEPDTGRALVVFGQQALAELEVIDLNLVAAGFQSEPFFAMDVQEGAGLSEPAIRDLSDVESYRLDPLNIAVGEQPEPPHPLVTSVRDSVEVRIYPNPSLYAATIEAVLPAGAYTARVVGVNGQVYDEQRFVLEQDGTLWRGIDVSRLTSGYYVVQLVRETGVVGVYPFIIRR